MTSRGGAGALRGAAVLLVALILALLVPSAAQAHSELQRSDPLDGAVVPVGRTTLTMWFGEQVAAASSSFVLHTQDGSIVPTTTTSGARATTVIEIETDPLARDTYQLDWRVFSLDDGHTTSGTLVFGAGLRPAPSTSQGSQIPPSALILVRWVDLTALLAAVGALTVGDRVLRTAGGRARRRARTIALIAVLCAWWAGALTPFFRAFDPQLGLGLLWDQTWLVLIDTPAGHFWLARQAALTVAVAAVSVWLRMLERPQRSAAVALLALAAAAGCSAWAGHAATVSDSTLVALASTAHVLAAGVWAGGLGVLACCLVPSLRGATGQRGALLGPVWRAYSPLAAISTVVLTATGMIQAGHHMPDLGAVTSTVYGAGVAAKTVLMVVALGFAALNTAVVHPGLVIRAGVNLPPAALWRLTLSSPRRFAATVTAEVVVLGLAVAMAAAVTSTATSREDLDARRPTTVHAERADGLYVTFEEVPGGPAKGRLIVRLRSITRPDPAPVIGVDVDLRSGGDHVLVPLALTDADRYEGTTVEPGPGTWTATVLVHRTNAADTVTSSSWTVDPKAGEGGTFQTVTTAVAALLLGLLVATLLVLRRRRRALDAPWPDARPDDVREPAPREASLT